MKKNLQTVIQTEIQKKIFLENWNKQLFYSLFFIVFLFNTLFKVQIIVHHAILKFYYYSNINGFTNE